MCHIERSISMSVIAITDRGVITIVEVKSEAVRDRDTILVGKTTYPMERKGSQSGVPSNNGRAEVALDVPRALAPKPIRLD